MEDQGIGQIGLPIPLMRITTLEQMGGVLMRVLGQTLGKVDLVDGIFGGLVQNIHRERVIYTLKELFQAFTLQLLMVAQRMDG